MKIAILYIATGQYINLWQSFYDSIKTYFLPEVKDKVFFLWSDDKPKLNSDVQYTYTPYKPYPHPLIHRYDILLTRKEDILQFDYCFFFNANMECVQNVSLDDLKLHKYDFIAAEHMTMPYMPFDDRFKMLNESYIPNNKKSPTYIDINIFKQHPDWSWLMGGFNGGKTNEWVKMSQCISDWVKQDEENGIRVKWHDEAYMNKYMLDKNVHRLDPKTYLQPDYIVLPQTKLIVRDKNRILGDDYRFKRTHMPGLLERILKQY